MSTPLKQWNSAKLGYTFGQPTWYSDFHLGVDHAVPENTPIYAWSDMTVTRANGKQMGITAHCKDEYGKHVRIGHCNQVIAGTYKKGEQIGLSGNTGELTTAAHTHTDVSYQPFDLYNRNNFIDPMIYFKNAMKVKVVANNSKWITPERLQAVRDFFPFRIDFDIVHTAYERIPWTKESVWSAWWGGQVWDGDYDVCALVMPTEQWKAKKRTGYQKNRPHRGVWRIDMKADEDGKRSNWGGWNDKDELTGRMVHEIMHVLFDACGKGDSDTVHYWDYERKDIAKALDDIDWDKIEFKPDAETFDRSKYIGKLIKNPDSPKVYYVGIEQTAWIENEEKFWLGVKEGWWGNFTTVQVIQPQITEDIVF